MCVTGCYPQTAVPETVPKHRVEDSIRLSKRPDLSHTGRALAIPKPRRPTPCCSKLDQGAFRSTPAAAIELTPRIAHALVDPPSARPDYLRIARTVHKPTRTRGQIPSEPKRSR